MSVKDTRTGDGGGYASPPCMAGEIAPDYFDPLAVDPRQAADVARWRKAERTRLLAERAALGVTALREVAEALAGHLDALLARRFGSVEGRVVSGYWPIKSEPDLRPWLARLHAAGARIALPVVATPRAPLEFRPWAPGAAMERGHWNIPVPATAETVQPEITLAPLVGWDGAGFRLGYGGGYFDRTLAAATPRPFVIGTGAQTARLATIFPQPHDIRLDTIVTEAGLQWDDAT
ncbi:MAG: 5-formyltetrahydrofolate cyclo-ligase [Gemmobacter sp.]